MTANIIYHSSSVTQKMRNKMNSHKSFVLWFTGLSGSGKEQVRDAYAVSNHLQFCVMATTLSWIYASRVENSLQRKHKVNNRSSFAFSDIRREISKVVLSEYFHRLCTNDEQTKLLLQLVA